MLQLGDWWCEGAWRVRGGRMAVHVVGRRPQRLRVMLTVQVQWLQALAYAHAAGAAAASLRPEPALAWAAALACALPLPDACACAAACAEALPPVALASAWAEACRQASVGGAGKLWWVRLRELLGMEAAESQQQQQQQWRQQLWRTAPARPHRREGAGEAEGEALRGQVGASLRAGTVVAWSGMGGG